MLNLDCLASIAGACSTPLVLHGGSGLSDDDFRCCVAGGISKINIFTHNNLTAAVPLTPISRNLLVHLN